MVYYKDIYFSIRNVQLVQGVVETLCLLEKIILKETFVYIVQDEILIRMINKATRLLRVGAEKAIQGLIRQLKQAFNTWFSRYSIDYFRKELLKK